MFSYLTLTYRNLSDEISQNIYFNLKEKDKTVFITLILDLVEKNTTNIVSRDGLVRKFLTGFNNIILVIKSI